MRAIASVIDYPSLVSKIQPKVVRSEAQNESYIALLEELDSRWEQLSAGEKELHALLGLLIRDYEQRAYKLHAASPIEVLSELIQANNLKQKDLVGIFETPSVISEVMNGKRELTKEHIKRLSQRFHVSPELFL